MTEVKIVGPTREWVEEYDDEFEPTGNGHYAQVLLFEAQGTDGQMYMQSLTMGDHVGDQADVLQRFRETGAYSLECMMRDKGVWPS